MDRLTHHDEVLQITEKAEIHWTKALNEFEESIWPIFERKGYSKDTALTVWWLNRIDIGVDNLAEAQSR